MGYEEKCSKQNFPLARPKALFKSYFINCHRQIKVKNLSVWWAFNQIIKQIFQKQINISHRGLKTLKCIISNIVEIAFGVNGINYLNISQSLKILAPI